MQTNRTSSQIWMFPRSHCSLSIKFLTGVNSGVCWAFVFRMKEPSRTAFTEKYILNVGVVGLYFGRGQSSLSQQIYVYQNPKIYVTMTADNGGINISNFHDPSKVSRFCDCYALFPVWSLVGLQIAPPAKRSPRICLIFLNAANAIGNVSTNAAKSALVMRSMQEAFQRSWRGRAWIDCRQLLFVGDRH